MVTIVVKMNESKCIFGIAVWFRKPSRSIDRILHKAVVNDNATVALDAVVEGADIDSVNGQGYTALEMARFLGRDALIAEWSSGGKHRIKVRGPEDAYPRVITVPDFEKMFGVRYYSHLRFDSYKTFRRARRQCPLLLKYSAVGTEQRWLGAWHAKERDEGHVAGGSIRWIDDEVGYGLFAEQRIEAHAHIGQYTGTVRKWKMFQQNQNVYCFHYPTGFCHLRIYMIDAQEGGNETRFINHSDTPNAEPLTQLDRGLLHIFIRTTRAVEYGEQICIDYGKDYWQRRTKQQLVD